MVPSHPARPAGDADRAAVSQTGDAAAATAPGTGHAPAGPRGTTGTGAPAPEDTAPGEPAPPGQPRRRRRRRRWAVALVTAVVVLALGAWAGACALRAQAELQAVRDDVTALRADPPDGIAPLLDRLRADRERATRARRLLDQPGPRVVAAVPVLGRSLAAERAVARAGEAVLVSAVDAGEVAEGVLAGSGVDLPALAELSRRLAAGAERVGPPLGELADVPVGLTPGVVQRAVGEARAVLLGLDDTLARAAAATEALGGVLGADGSRQVLVALENNAELRGRGGLVSVFATGTTRDGQLELGAFQQVADVADEAAGEQPARVDVPGVVAEHYGRYLADTTAWQQANMAADGPLAAATLAAVAGATLDRAPDVVVLVDVPAMASVVAATQPVALPDGQLVDGDRLVDLLLVDAYQDAGERLETQDARRRALSALATGAAARLLGGEGIGGESVALLRALTEAALGRHVAVWSARPEEQAALETAGLAGSVDPHGDDIAMVTVNNLPGNKLDLYVDRALTVDAVVGPDGVSVTQRLHLRNDAPEGLPWYVEGRDRPGRWAALLDMAASPTARDVTLTADGQPAPVELRQESGATRVVTTVALERGEEVDLELRYEVPPPDPDPDSDPDADYALRLVPQPLARPATVEVRIRAADGSELGRIEGADRRGGEGSAWSGAGGRVEEAGPFERVRRIAVRLHEPDAWDRFSRFWSEPVTVGLAGAPPGRAAPTPEAGAGAGLTAPGRPPGSAGVPGPRAAGH